MDETLKVFTLRRMARTFKRHKGDLIRRFVVLFRINENQLRLLTDVAAKKNMSVSCAARELMLSQLEKPKAQHEEVA